MGILGILRIFSSKFVFPGFFSTKNTQSIQMSNLVCMYIISKCTQFMHLDLCIFSTIAKNV
jgi:hypothetical protein